MDTLTLCAAAFVSLLYPFKWMHPLVPLLPTTLIEYLEAPTPYLMGVQTRVYESDECQAAIEDVIVVQLDYDKVLVPKSVKTEFFPKPFIKKMEKYFQSHIPPPASRFFYVSSYLARILYCDEMNPLKANYLVFEVMFGPGKLGIKMKSRKQCLTENEEKMEVVFLENVPDEDITIVGPGKRVPLLRREPVILAVNGKSVTGMNLKQVVQILGDAVRPLTLRLQIGTAPVTPSMNLYSSIRMSSDLSPLAEIPGSDSSSSPESPVVEKEEVPPASPLELTLDDSILSPVTSLRRSLSPRNLSPQDSEGRVVRRYYRERSYRVTSTESEIQEEDSKDSKDSKEDDTEGKQAVFVEHMRVYFLLEMCELLDGYEDYIRRNGQDK